MDKSAIESDGLVVGYSSSVAFISLFRQLKITFM